MSYLLRQVKGDSWLNLTLPQTIEDYPADPITDLKTSSNKLSVFTVENEERDVYKIVAALVVGSNKIKELSYVLINLEEMESQNFTLDDKDGDTPSKVANKLHKDICDLTLDGLIKIVQIINKNPNIVTKSVPEVISMIKKAYSNDELPSLKKEKHHNDFHAPLGVQCECGKMKKIDR